jgi:hypothetical protein
MFGIILSLEHINNIFISFITISILYVDIFITIILLIYI